MGRNTSISLGDHFENFVDNRVTEGRFKNASEVVRAGLRLLEEEESKIVVLKKAIAEGLESGIAKNFDAKKHLAKLKTAKEKMANYILTNKAVEDISNIWNYSFEVWSESQAEKYYYLLLDGCQELADEKLKGKNYEIIDAGLLGCRVGQHIIFYKKIKLHTMLIVRILHSRMDLKNRIDE